jgi:hypothetical protein
MARWRMQRRRRNLGSAGCQPAVVGSLPTTHFVKPEAVESVLKLFRQAAETNRLAACAPQQKMLGYAFRRRTELINRRR